LDTALIKAIERKMEFSDKINEDSLVKRIQDYEELKIKVKPKLVVVKKELAHVVEIFKTF
jgi:hypothetical protein